MAQQRSLNSSLNTTEALSWFSISGGQICLGKVPDAEKCLTLQDAGVTHVATVLTAAEDAQTVHVAANNSGLNWMWLPFEFTTQSNESDQDHWQQYLVELHKRLQEGGRMYLHCDNTRRRCRLLFFALCHYLRIPSSSAYCILHSFDPGGANSLLRRELQWAATLGSSAR